MTPSKQATTLMARITHQLRPPSTTTMAACRRCGRSSPGGQLCAGCLCEDLGVLIDNAGAALRWLESQKRATQDEQTVIAFANRAKPRGPRM